MAKYDIHGNRYEVDDSIQGEQLTKTLEQLVQHAQQRNVQKFLGFLGKAEGADYDTIVGGSKFTDYTKHPNVIGLRTKEGPSTAAGRYQITHTTYSEFAKKLGINDFSPESQDKIAQAIIEQEGALEAVKTGDFNTAISKLGGRWASLPSSRYSQPKRSAEWAQKELSTALPDSPPSAAPVGQPAAGRYGPVRQKIDPATLKTDQGWLQASRAMHGLRERRDFTGSDEELAEWGKELMGNFNFNLVDMTRYAADLVRNGTQEEKEAFLYLMDSYDNTEFSWEGTKRAAKAIGTDPTTYVGLGTLGIGTVGKIMGAAAAKQGVKKALLESVGRTGVIAGIEGGILSTAENAIKQGVEVDAGRKKEVSGKELAISAGAGAVGGLVLGTAADAAFTGIAKVLRKEASGKAPSSPKVEPHIAPEGTPAAAAIDAPTASPEVPAAVSPEGTPGTPTAAALETPAVAPEGALPGTILTDAEIKAATERGQKGRLWVDDLPPVTPENPAETAKLELPDTNTGLRSTPRSMEELTQDGMKIADQLRALPDRDMHGVLESFRNLALPLEDMRVIARGVQLHADELRIKQAELLKEMNLPGTPDARKAEIPALLDEVEKRLIPLSLADDAFGSMAGSMLRQRQEGLPGLQGVTIDSLVNEKGLTREAAEATYIQLVEASKQTAKAQEIAKTYDSQIQASLQQGNLTEAARLTAMKHRELEGMAEQQLPGGASFMQKANEFVISNVFSPTTVAINFIPAAVKTLVLPMAKAAVSNPLAKATRVELAASYSAMGSTLGQAWRAARASFRYEQSLLTRGSGRLMEGELAMKGKMAGVWRFLPRVLNASDEFLSQVNYNGFVAGQAAAKAVTDGAEKGLTGKALNDFIKEATEKALKDAYTQPDGEALIQPLVNKGVNLGLTGDELHEWVMRELKRNPEALRHGSNEEALDAVRDVLYKRKFSGEGVASQAAQSYETFTNRVPAWKLIFGQLFFRTPIRVFEEGVRLTPGLQILAPKFLSDLAGKNGTMRQARAQAEAMTSLAITGAVLSLYAAGRITGDGAYNDWKQQRTRTDGPAPAPYSIIMEDGSTWSYRNFDPIATPFKIMINGLERMDRLAIRQAQGEFIDKSMWDQARAYVSVGTSAITAALRDANLVQGLDQTIEFFEAMKDPEANEGKYLKMFGEKLQLLVPNTLTKIAKENDPTIKDPATFWQVVETRLAGIKVDREEVKTSYSYDVLGNPRKLTDTGTLWNIFSVSTPEERSKGMSEEGQKVMLELDRLQKETGATFAPPLKHKMTGPLDLRTILTEDKTETLYDRWQRNYRDLQPEKILYPVVTAEMPDGTFKHKAMRVETVQGLMNELRDVAFMRTMAQEQRVIDEVIKLELNKAKARSGQLDFSVRDK